MKNIVVIIIIALILIASIGYIYRAKKRGEKCIGCPNSKNCNKRSCNI